MSISELTRKAIQKISQNGQSITPLVFYDKFCTEARISGVAVQDCNIIREYIEKLDVEFQNEVSRYNMKTIPQFLSYLTSALNRMNQNHLGNRHMALLELTQAIVKTTALIDNKDIHLLSGRTEALLFRGHTSENLNDFRKEWARLSSSRQWRATRDTLGRFVEITVDDDLDSIVEKIVPILEKGKEAGDSRRLAELLVQGATPSLSKSDDETQKLYKELRAEPKRIYNPDVQKRVSFLQTRRIELDRSEERNSVGKVGKIVDKLSEGVNSDKNSSTNPSKGIEDVIKDVKESSANSNSLLSSITGKLENVKKKTSSLFGSFQKYKEAVQNAKKEIDKAVNELIESRKKNDVDTLTGLGNEVSLKNDLQDLEKRFQSKNENFAVIVIDIDNFKDVCSKYGDDAGDLVLRYFSKILKSYISVGDSTARVGEDEFVISLPKRDLTTAIQFAQHFQGKVQHTKFLYKEERVSISFSAGVADRGSNTTFGGVLDRAHKMMRIAKKRGKNIIIPELK